MNQEQIAQMTEAAAGMAVGVGFLTKDLHAPEVWHAMAVRERLARGRWFSGAVRRGELPDVELAGVDVHNHRVYVKLR